MTRHLRSLLLLGIGTLMSMVLVSGVVIYINEIHSQKLRIEAWANAAFEKLHNYSPPHLNRQHVGPLDRPSLISPGQTLQIGEVQYNQLYFWYEQNKTESHIPASLLRDAIAGSKGFRRVTLNTNTYLFYLLPINQKLGLVIGEPIAQIRTVTLHTWALIVIANAILLIIAGVLSQHILRPINEKIRRQLLQHSLSWDSMSGIALRISSSLYILDANPRFESMFELTTGNHLSDATSKEKSGDLGFYVLQALQERSVIEFECILVDTKGTRSHWAMTARPWDLDGQESVLLCGDDVTRHHRMALELQAEQERVNLYLDAMQTLLIICDHEGNVLRMNQQAEDLIAMPGESLHKQPIWSLLRTDDRERIKSLWQRLPTIDGHPVDQFALISSSGKESTINWQFTVVRYPDSDHIDILMAGLDVTESIANQQALEVANRQIREALNTAKNANRTKSIFLASMSHEIRTPMNGVLGAAELLLDSPLDKEQRGCVEIIHSSSHVLLDIINDILDLSKIESGKLEIEAVDFDLNQLLNDLFHLFHQPARQKELSLIYRFDNKIPTIWRGDPKRIRQIVTNLLSNAVKFTHQGHIELHVEGQRLNGDSYQLQIHVNDTGIGIPESKQEQIFSAFRQADTSTSRQYGGTGLGLTICRHLAIAMGGSITLKTAADKGSSFTLSLALLLGDADKLQILQPSTARPAIDFRTKILLAEDNPVNQKIAEKMLTRMGLRCTSVNNGQEAVRAVIKENFDLILMDVNMPILDGISATQQIRDFGAAKSTIPILALTANAMMEDRQRCLDAGMNGFISKPIRMDSLRAAIASLLPNVTQDKSEN
ncbi:ATP-binding protein [Thalassolituus sp.]|jgi:PAS domain S-box-containing protein|uniref:ATP-binding protein n=1 Tax=Thalassolituus sp. TaxID=2030822 RepID=UPI002A81E136|nr:ATP-binding protein [Thalassolituus sp.]